MAMSWYYYLESKISFPFQARCIAAKAVSPLRKGETVEVIRMAPEDCEHDMLVRIRWQGPKMAAFSEFCLRLTNRRPGMHNRDALAKRNPKSQPTWTDVKAPLMSFDRPG